MLARVRTLQYTFVLVATVGGALGLQAHGQTQVVLEPSKDNTLYQSSAGELSNGAGQYFFVGRTNQASNSIRRALLAFDVAGHIPPNSTILSATLTLNMSRTISGTHTVSLHRATADWGEGTSVALGNEGGGAPSAPGDATWLHRFFNSTFWGTVGGDFVATPSAEQSVAGIESYTWGSTAAMVSDVQLWLTSPSSNFGWLMKGNETAAATSKRFGSRQNVNPAARPKLTVTYQPALDIEEIRGVPQRFALYQNYPNPFSAKGGSASGGNPTTAITFDIAERSFVSLKVTDVVGRDVATIVSESLQPGRYVRHWNPEGLATGVYFYRLSVVPTAGRDLVTTHSRVAQAGSFVQTRKLLLVR